MLVEYLDNSMDSYTIILEIEPLECYQNLVLALFEVDAKTELCLRNIIDDDFMLDTQYTLNYDLCTLIRSVWDIAYNHGYVDCEKDNEEEHNGILD